LLASKKGQRGGAEQQQRTDCNGLRADG